MRIRDQIKDRNDRAPMDAAKNVGTFDDVLKDYARNKAKSWADPQSLPVDVGERITFLGEAGDSQGWTETLDELGLISHEGRPNITMKYPYLRTGKVGRGELGRDEPAAQPSRDSARGPREPHRGDALGRGTWTTTTTRRGTRSVSFARKERKSKA